MSAATVPTPGGRIGVLLVNLGTPDATDYWSMRRYLKEFLSDRRVIEENRIKWWLVLNPITRSQSDKLEEIFEKVDRRIRVDWAMRYGNPSIRSRLDALAAQDCERVLLVPLYPQYAAATTATVCDEAFRALARMRLQPSLRVAAPYYAEPAYIDALASSLNAELAKLKFKPEMIVASYHGMPEDYVAKGDPYYRHCSATTALLRKKLKLDEDGLIMTFQSRFGTAEWLKPYTDATMKTLGQRGVKKIAVIMPGFAADCLETLEEIAMENAEIFKHGGGKDFAAIPCLNDSGPGMAVIRDVVLRELKGWI